jgi:tetratricopeptide (TPR) repeat protein
MYKGLEILSQKKNALDYFLSGVKIDPQHYGCAYNCAYSYFVDLKYRNALKWFDLALKLKQTDEALYGKAIVSFKLDLVKESQQAVSLIVNKSQEHQMLLLLTHRLLGQHKEASLLYQTFKEAI